MQTKQFLLRFFLVLVTFCPSVHLLADPVTSGGYYYIVSSNAWSYSDQTNAVYANGDYCKWGALKDHSSAYIWQFKLLSNGNYSVRNLLTDTYVNNISESKICFLTSKSTSEVSLVALTGDQYNVSVVEGGSGSHKMHCEGHNDGKGRGGNIVGYSGGANGPSSWRLVAVSDEVLTSVLDNLSAERELVTQRQTLADRITAIGAATRWAFRCQLPSDAVDVTPASAADFESNAGMIDGAPQNERHGVSWGKDGTGFGALIDGDKTTFFHSTWKTGDLEWSDYNVDKTPAEGARPSTLHNLSMHLRQPARHIAFQLSSRNESYNNPTKVDVEASLDGKTWQTICYGYDLHLTNIHPEHPYLIGPFDLGAEYPYVRFACHSNDRTNNGTRYFCLSELRVFDGARLDPNCAAAQMDAQVVNDFLSAYSDANRYMDIVTVDDTEGIKSSLTRLNAAYKTFSAQLPSVTTFTNPVLNTDAPDPSVIRGNDGNYYLFSTAEHVYRSPDMVNWTYVRQAFGDNPRPTFVDGPSVYWAPCVTEQDGRYVLYFCLSNWGGGDPPAVGVATSDRPDGPYRLVGNGKLFSSTEVGVENSIDPFYFEDKGKKYIIWGSWHGIWAIELTEDGLAVKDIKNKKKLADTKFEASYVYKRNGYYYLFCSIGACCEGLKSTYQTVVGRATSFLGPYRTRDGKSMLNNDYMLFLNSSSTVVGPGHNSRIIEDESGQTWMYYHGYRRDDGDRGRVVWLDRVQWDAEGWPYVEGGGPSMNTQVAPLLTPRSLQTAEVHRDWGARSASITPVDLRNDGHMQLFVTGTRGESTDEIAAKPTSLLLQSDAQGQWTSTSHELLPGIDASVVPCDIDGDGTIDLVAFGRAAAEDSRGIFLGNGDGTFRQQQFTVQGGDAALINQASVADVNNDGRPDLVVVGNRQNAVLLQGDDFHFQCIPFCDDATYLAVRTADFNNDGFVDIFAYGSQSAELYLNDGTSMAFASIGWDKQFPVPTDGGLAIADLTNNSFLDLFVAGNQSALCANQGDSNFRILSSVYIDPYALNNHNWSRSTALAFDWNTDNYYDLFYQGVDQTLGIQSGSIWLRKPGGKFTREVRYAAGEGGASAIVDWNADGVPDVVSTGYSLDRHLLPETTQRGTTFMVTLGDGRVAAVPEAPTMPQADVQGNRVTLHWQPGSRKNVTHEVFIRDSQGRLLGNCRSYVGGELDGQRKCMDIGNLSYVDSVSYTLPEGRYTWGVQTVNASLQGSPFATGEFVIGSSDDVSLPAQSASQPTFYNALGQRVTLRQRGLRIVQYADGTTRKQFVR